MYPDYRSGLHISGLRIRIHDWLNIYQDLQYSYADIYSRDKIKNNKYNFISDEKLCIFNIDKVYFIYDF